MNEAYSLRWVVAAGPTDQSGTPEPNMKTVTVEATFLMRYTSGGAPLVTPNSIETVFQTFVTE